MISVFHRNYSCFISTGECIHRPRALPHGNHIRVNDIRDIKTHRAFVFTLESNRSSFCPREGGSTPSSYPWIACGYICDDRSEQRTCYAPIETTEMRPKWFEGDKEPLASLVLSTNPSSKLNGWSSERLRTHHLAAFTRRLGIPCEGVQCSFPMKPSSTYTFPISRRCP